MDLLSGDVADPEVANQSLLLELDEGPECLDERTRLRTFGIAHAQIDKIQYFDPE